MSRIEDHFTSTVEAAAAFERDHAVDDRERPTWDEFADDPHMDAAEGEAAWSDWTKRTDSGGCTEADPCPRCAGQEPGDCDIPF